MGSNEETNAAGTDTRPPMLVESDYESWKIRIHRYIRGKPNGKLIWKSIQNGPTPHPMITDPPSTDSAVVPAPRKKLDSEFSEEENKLEMADTQAEIILSQGLPRHIFNNLNQTSTNKEIWDNVECLCKDPRKDIHKGKEDLLMNELQVCHNLPSPIGSTHHKNNHFRLPPNSRTHATVHDVNLFTEPIQRKTPGVHQKEHYTPMLSTEIDDNTIPYHHIFLTPKPKMFQLRYLLDHLDKVSKICQRQTAFLQQGHPGTRNPGLGIWPSVPTCFVLFRYPLSSPLTTPVLDWDSEEVLVHQVVSMKKMNEKPGHVRPANGFYDKLNALMFVPQKDLSGDQAYWLSANEIASQASKSATPATPFVRKSRPPSQVLASLRNVNAVFPQFEGIIKERTTQRPDYVSEWCFDYAKQFVEQQLVPFYDHFKKHIQAANDTFFKEIKEFEQIFDELEAEYEQCVLDNKNLTIEKKNLLIINECLIAECLEKDICSIVLTSDIVVPPSPNCLCEDLRSACDREHTKVLKLEAEISKQKQLITESEKRFAFLEQNYVSLQLKFQNYKQCIDTSSASNAIFEINKLRKQLQGKDDTIRNLDAQINIMKVLNVGSTEGRCDQQALETDRIQLKDTITSLRIQLDGLKVENVSLKRRYDELSQENTHSRTAYTEKLSALTAGNNQLKAQVTGKTSSGPSTSETPKVLAPGMYNLGSKYIPPPKRANWVKPTPLPKKRQVTFSEPPRPSLKPTQKPVVHPNKQTNVCVPMSTGVKPTSGASKTVPKRAPRNHSSLPAKSANARRVEAHHRTLNKKNRVDSNLLVKHSVSVSNLNNVCGACNKSLVFANHNDCLVMCDDSVNVKPHQTKRLKRQPKKEWKPIKNVGKHIKRVWKPFSKLVANSKPQWKPTGRHFALYDNRPLTRIMEPIVEPLELTPSVSSSSKVTMISRFPDCKLCDPQSGSKGISGILNC
ncbi:hypothetical protein Tco_0298522 [Tanacetum coccineum]